MPIQTQTTAFADEMFPTSGIVGVNFYDADPEARVAPGTVIAEALGNKKAVYAKATAALASGAGAAVSATFEASAGAGYKALARAGLAVGQFGWFVSDTKAV
jgi:hypothetical protein